MYLPNELIEHIGNYCDIDTRRHLGLLPKKLKTISPITQFPSNQMYIEVPIKNTNKRFIIDRNMEVGITTYYVSKGWLPSASRHVVYYDKEGHVGIYTAREECDEFFVY